MLERIEKGIFFNGTSYEVRVRVQTFLHYKCGIKTLRAARAIRGSYGVDMSVKRTQRKRREPKMKVYRPDKQLLNYATQEEIDQVRALEAEPTSPKVHDKLISRMINEAY